MDTVSLIPIGSDGESDPIDKPRIVRISISLLSFNIKQIKLTQTKANKEETWSSFVNGNEASYEALYHFYFKTLCDFGLRLCADKEIVKDCIQEIFIKLWVNRANLHNIKSIKSYLFSALRNAIFNFYASPRSKNDVITAETENLDFVLEYSPEEILIGREIETEKTRKVKLALNELTARQKELIYFKYYIGLDYNEIAEVMQITVKACYKLMGRALEILKESVHKKGGKDIFLWFLHTKAF